MKFNKEAREKFLARLKQLVAEGDSVKSIVITMNDEGFRRPSGELIEGPFIYQMKSRYFSEGRGDAAMKHLARKDKEEKEKEAPSGGILEELSELERNETEVDDQEPEAFAGVAEFQTHREEATRFPTTELPSLANAILRDVALRAEQKVKMLLVYTEA